MQAALVKYAIQLLAPSMRAPNGGIAGWLARELMQSGNPPSTTAAFHRLQLQSSDTFVEIGAGNGAGLRAIRDGVAGEVPHKTVLVEISPDFRKELEEAIADLEFRDRIELHGEDCRYMGYLEDGSVNKIFGMNVVYFLNPLQEYMREFHRVLAPQGSITFGCKFKMLPKDNDVFVNVEEELIKKTMEQSGFTVTSGLVELDEAKYNYIEIIGTKL